MVNVRDFDEIKAKVEAYYADGNAEKAQWYTGPDTGIWYDEDTKEIKIASGWHADTNGDIVRD